MPEIDFQLPIPPWTHENLGEEKYCEVATKLGFFNPKAEDERYRPSLDHTPYLETIKAQQAAKPKQGAQ